MNREYIASLARDIQAQADVIAAFADKADVSEGMVRTEAHNRIAIIASRSQWILDQVGPEDPVDPLTSILGQQETKLPAGVHTLGARVPLSGRTPRYGRAIKPDKPPEDAA